MTDIRLDMTRCSHCDSLIEPDDFGQRGDGPALQDPGTGLPYCNDRCLTSDLAYRRAQAVEDRKTDPQI